MKKLILVCGKARSGKDTFVGLLEKELDSFQSLDITGGLKDVVAKMFGVRLEALEEMKDNESFCDAWVSDGNGGLGRNCYTARHFLQFIGNEIAPPLLGKFHWCMERQHKLFSVDKDINVLCGVRQLKEIEYFTKMNPDKEVIIVKLERTKNGEDYSPISEADKGHSTETEVDMINPDFIYRCENIKEIKDAAKDFLIAIK